MIIFFGKWLDNGFKVLSFSPKGPRNIGERSTKKLADKDGPCAASATSCLPKNTKQSTTQTKHAELKPSLAEPHVSSTNQNPRAHTHTQTHGYAPYERVCRPSLPFLSFLPVPSIDTYLFNFEVLVVNTFPSELNFS